MDQVHSSQEVTESTPVQNKSNTMCGVYNSSLIINSEEFNVVTEKLRSFSNPKDLLKLTPKTVLASLLRAKIRSLSRLLNTTRKFGRSRKLVRCGSNTNSSRTLKLLVSSAFPPVTP